MNAADHHATATQLLADVNETIDTPSAARVLAQAAIAHALLGLLEIQMAKQHIHQWNINYQPTEGN